MGPMLSNPATLRRVGEEGHETGIADQQRQVIPAYAVSGENNTIPLLNKSV